MPNKERGEITFEYKGTEYLLCLKFNNFVTIESCFDLPIHDALELCFMGKKPKLGFRELRYWFFGAADNEHNEVAGLFKDANNREKKLNRIGEVMQELGGFVPANKLIVDAISAAFPREGKGKKK